MKKRILASILTLAMMLCCAVPCALAATPGMGNFQRTQTYTPGQFVDVPLDAWYANSVKNAYELGLMQGSDSTWFNVNGNLTIAEAVTMAARLHSIYHTGQTLSLTATTSWYAPYVDYARKNGILKSDYLDYNAPANRAQFAQLFASALPQGVLGAINTIADNALPDVKLADSYGADVYLLYRAGVLTGNDAYGTFAPATSIQRNAAAAIVARMAVPSLRKSFVLHGVPVLNEIVMYEKDPEVPDFGAYFGAPIQYRMAYYYRYDASGLSDDTDEVYAAVLIESGYHFYENTRFSYGDDAAVYVNHDESVRIMCGYTDNKMSYWVIIEYPNLVLKPSVGNFYGDYSGVPDFGKMAGIKPVPCTKKGVYEYPVGSEFAQKLFQAYQQLLQDNGYRFREYGKGWFGERAYVYTNENMKKEVILNLTVMGDEIIIIVGIAEL